MCDVWQLGMRKIGCFLHSWHKLLIPFILRCSQPYADKPQYACRHDSLVCVLGILLILHGKYPDHLRKSHARSERVAPRTTAARHLRIHCNAKSGISHKNKKPSRDKFARHVWFQPAFVMRHRARVHILKLCTHPFLTIVRLKLRKHHFLVFRCVKVDVVRYPRILTGLSLSLCCNSWIIRYLWKNIPPPLCLKY